MEGRHRHEIVRDLVGDRRRLAVRLARSTAFRIRPTCSESAAPSVDFNGLGVVMVPPVGYDHSSSFRALQVLARALTERGCLVVRVEPFGTGDKDQELQVTSRACTSGKTWWQRERHTSGEVAPATCFSWVVVSAPLWPS